MIDHLWHLAETGYYHRQGGPYPPFTWKIGSIVDHKHQKAAYAGIIISTAMPTRPNTAAGSTWGTFMAAAINVDVLSREGATYRAHAEPDFLTANDAWFMPVSQKTGPDGCLYILDWYDRYHCYQDAKRDPAGIDRLKGRIYRIRYKQSPRVWGFDLAKETDDALLARLASGANDYYRTTIVRLLSERRHASTRPTLERMALDQSLAFKVRMRAIWALVGSDLLSDAFLHTLLAPLRAGLSSLGRAGRGQRGTCAGRNSPADRRGGGRHVARRAPPGGDCRRRSGESIPSVCCSPCLPRRPRIG